MGKINIDRNLIEERAQREIVKQLGISGYRRGEDKDAGERARRLLMLIKYECALRYP